MTAPGLPARGGRELSARGGRDMEEWTSGGGERHLSVAGEYGDRGRATCRENAHLLARGADTSTAAGGGDEAMILPEKQCRRTNNRQRKTC